jgi:integrase
LAPRGRVRWLTAVEEVALRAAIDANPEWLEHRPEWLIAVNTGRRLSEQCDLEWPQVDLERRVIWIPRSKHGEGRHVRRNEETIIAFRQVLARNGGIKRGRVFAHMTGTDAKRHEWFNETVAAAGIDDFRWHDLRHTFARRLVMDGVPRWKCRG